jgi:hypothetical protein
METVWTVAVILGFWIGFLVVLATALQDDDMFAYSKIRDIATPPTKHRSGNNVPK